MGKLRSWTQRWLSANSLFEFFGQYLYIRKVPVALLYSFDENRANAHRDAD